MKGDTLGWVAMLLLVVGGVNWGLVGLADMNLVDQLFGAGSMVAKAVYALVGLSALYVGATQLMKGK